MTLFNSNAVPEFYQGTAKEFKSAVEGVVKSPSKEVIAVYPIPVNNEMLALLDRSDRKSQADVVIVSAERRVFEADEVGKVTAVIYWVKISGEDVSIIEETGEDEYFGFLCPFEILGLLTPDPEEENPEEDPVDSWRTISRKYYQAAFMTESEIKV